ncbi:MAG: hypothetical protein AB9834_16380 [Lentimicrobium sp.]
MDNPTRTTLIFGDIIRNKAVNELTGEEKDLSYYFKNIKGTFYIIRINKIERTIEAASSIFGIFPVYFAETLNGFAASSDYNTMLSILDSRPTISRRFILEKVLFYYPLFERTIYENIKLLAANSLIIIRSDSITINKYFEFSNYFKANPLPYKRHTAYLTDLFIESTKDYFPDELFYLTFTGGFDGRTLVACAKHSGSNFKTFSIGDQKSDDVVCPLHDSQLIGIDYKPVYVDNEEYKLQFMNFADNLMQGTGLATNMLYTHFYYAASLISRESNYLLTGFGGSEIFRALDIRGAVTSHELVDFFEYTERDLWKDKIMNSPKLRLLDGKSFKNELDELISDLEEYKKSFPAGYGMNAQIYIYLYEEVFRKVFGPVICGMSDYITVRNPYFDFGFNKELLDYSLAGVYSEFFVKNPIKRFKGQVLYGHIINKTFPLLAGLKTGKGYRPKDLTHLTGKLFITHNFVKKRVARKIINDNLDNFSLVSAITRNINELNALTKKYEYFNNHKIDDLVNSGIFHHKIMERDLLLLIYSVLKYLDNNEKNISFNRL